MSEVPDSIVPVQTAVVLDTLVNSMYAEVEERAAGDPPEPVASVLMDADQALITDDDEDLDRGLRYAGYLARRVEVDFFEPARRPATWVHDVLTERLESAGSWAAAVAAACGDLARAEPLERPEPSDPHAMSWRVPGPGGHVRHYLARRTIEERLQDFDRPVQGDPAELKRSWLYGFFVRTCEEALPEGAELDGDGTGHEPDAAGPDEDAAARADDTPGQN